MPCVTIVISGVESRPLSPRAPRDKSPRFVSVQVAATLTSQRGSKVKAKTRDAVQCLEDSRRTHERVATETLHRRPRAWHVFLMFGVPAEVCRRTRSAGADRPSKIRYAVDELNGVTPSPGAAG